MSGIEKAAEALSRRGLSICITGIDGCGKTTLSTQLASAMLDAGIPVRRLHIYRWYQNFFVTPMVIIYNRLIGRRVLIFDRTIYDNLIVAGVASPWLRPHLAGFFRMLRFFYPAFDLRYYLHVPYDETVRRRPDTIRKRFRLLENGYGVMLESSRWHVFETDRDIFDDAVDALNADL